jgi:hypothetical protein
MTQYAIKSGNRQHVEMIPRSAKDIAEQIAAEHKLDEYDSTDMPDADKIRSMLRQAVEMARR